MTIILIIVTSLISLLAFSRPEIFSRLQFNAVQIWHGHEQYRMISHGFIHADYMHLLINMLVLYSFGVNVEYYFHLLNIQGIIHVPQLYFLFLYLAGIVISSLLTLYKQKDNQSYNAVGASGAVSAVVFTNIFFAPLQKVYFFGLLPLPGIVFAILYLLYSQFMGRKGVDNINHDAHFAGALWGFLFPLLIDFRLIYHFLGQLGLR